MERWRKRAGVAQFTGANWDNKLEVKHGLTLEEAKRFGEKDPKTTYFFYCNGHANLGSKGYFYPHEAVFFSGKPHYGSMPECDAYELVIFDPAKMVPLRDCQYVSLRGEAILKGPREILFDTGSWTTNIPYEWINKEKVKVLEKDVVNDWNQLSDKVEGQLALMSEDGKKTYEVDKYIFFAIKEWNLRLMSVNAAGDLPAEGRNLIIVALAGADLHVRIFDASGTKSVDKAESNLKSGQTSTALKAQLQRASTSSTGPASLASYEASLSKEAKQKIIEDAASIADYDISPTIIMGALPGEDPSPSLPLPSLPLAIAKKYSDPGKVGLGIVSHAEGDIHTHWQSFRSYLQIGTDPKITGLLNWRKNIPLFSGRKQFSPEDIPGFKVTFSFPGMKEQIVVANLMATIDTGAPELTLRLGENDPQNQEKFKKYFTDRGPAWRDAQPQYKQDSKCLVKGVTVRIEFTDSAGRSNFYTFLTNEDFDSSPPIQVIVGKWNSIVPWPVDTDTPRTRINLGNTIYFYCPVYFWDISDKRVGLYFK